MKRIKFIALFLSLGFSVFSCKQEPVFEDVPLVERLAREWKLSVEEAQPGREVYRTTSFQFPDQAYRPTYRFTPDQKLTISHQFANGSVRFYVGTWQLSEDEQMLTISALNPYTFRPLAVRWRLVNVRSDLLLVEPQS